MPAFTLDEYLQLEQRFQNFDLSYEFFPGMPAPARHPQYAHSLARRHGDALRPDGSSSAADQICTGTHVGTHIDAFSHYSLKGRLYAEVDASEAQTGGSFRQHGIETAPSFFCRGVLLDLPSLLGVDVVPSDLTITEEVLAECAVRQGVQFRGGDVALVRTGWEQHFFTAPADYLRSTNGVPGIDGSGAKWLAAQGVCAAGTDTATFDQVPRGVTANELFDLPAHRVLLVEQGVYILENLRLTELASAGATEFAFVMLPLKYRGATGSPVRPIARVLERGDR